MTICSNCGASVELARFCDQCGKALAPPLPQASATPRTVVVPDPTASAFPPPVVATPPVAYSPPLPPQRQGPVPPPLPGQVKLQGPAVGAVAPPLPTQPAVAPPPPLPVAPAPPLPQQALPTSAFAPSAPIGGHATIGPDYRSPAAPGSGGPKTVLIAGLPDAPSSKPPAPLGDATTAVLRLKEMGVATDRTFLIGADVTIGRFDPELGPVDVDLSGLGPTDHISRRHARISRRAGDWIVEDLGSKNGVFVRRAPAANQRVSSATSLQLGDEVSFGMVTFIFEAANVVC